jgi:hypothetical protein
VLKELSAQSSFSLDSTEEGVVECPKKLTRQWLGLRMSLIALSLFGREENGKKKKDKKHAT